MLTGRLSPPESSQHSRSQARVKEEGCVRFWQTSIKNSHSNGFETHKKLIGGVTLLGIIFEWFVRCLSIGMIGTL